MKRDQRKLFDDVSYHSSRIVSLSYSTSFSSGIRLLNKKFRDPIFSIYGFVRFADEIVDTFHEHNKGELLRRFKADTYLAIEEQVSLNPILNSFQLTCRQYGITHDLIDIFLQSMEMDLQEKDYDRNGFEQYILGSAEVVGLMCLKVFTQNDTAEYEKLKPYAMSLGAAFQKINFLRDIKADFEGLGRTYFPGMDFQSFSEEDKRKIEAEIEKDFQHAYQGILLLRKEVRLGVLVAYVYYRSLFMKIRNIPSHRIMQERIRIPNQQKLALVMSCLIRNNLNLVK